jgi:SAM-dependent methyltransferase
MTQLYDKIGAGYGRLRQPDPRIASAIAGALGPSESVVNVGAGAGSYEPSDRRVVAVEPSSTMIRQRPPRTAPVVQASAVQLPFGDATFAAALAILTVHHWPDRARGLAELARVARERVVLLTFDVDASRFWLVDDYFPEIAGNDRRMMPSIEEIEQALGPIEVRPLLIPHDCTDGFLGAYWRRPEAYLDAGVRRAISAFALLRDVEPGLARLRDDLRSGAWHDRHANLLGRHEIDLGYRLITSSRIP